MSKEAIKMANLFHLPVSVDIQYGDYPAYDEYSYLNLEGEEAEAAAHAINTHDALVQHNAELTEALSNLVKEVNTIDVRDSMFDFDQVDSAVKAARAALSKEQGQ